MTVSHFILSAVCIGFAHALTEWFFLGFLFHKYQALTPQTWRPESSKSYMYSTLLSFAFGALFTLFYYKIGSHYVLPSNIFSHIKLGLICFACFSLVSNINSSVYVNYDKKFVFGLLTSSGVNFVVAAIIASHFYWK
ncbi:MAG TPA: hypothetical protein VK668_01285 [Mucilaginibacter sp.]|nr:hypothetical protein [Mucilaginibacter sp.]